MLRDLFPGPRTLLALQQQKARLLEQLVEERERLEEKFLALYELGRRDERGACVWRIVVNGEPAIRCTVAYKDACYEIWQRQPETETIALEQYDGGQWRVVRASMREASA